MRDVAAECCSVRSASGTGQDDIDVGARVSVRGLQHWQPPTEVILSNS